jgi:hypothetical protein
MTVGIVSRSEVDGIGEQIVHVSESGAGGGAVVCH